MQPKIFYLFLSAGNGYETLGHDCTVINTYCTTHSINVVGPRKISRRTLNQIKQLAFGYSVYCVTSCLLNVLQCSPP